MSLVNQFEPAEIVVTERKDRESTYRRLDAAALADWLEEHSLSDLWETNVIGGRP
jgi:hypothetical protein